MNLTKLTSLIISVFVTMLLIASCGTTANFTKSEDNNVYYCLFAIMIPYVDATMTTEVVALYVDEANLYDVSDPISITIKNL